MKIRHNVALLPYTTFKMGGEAAYFADLESVADIKAFAAFAREKNLPLVILGGGSNVVASDQPIPACVGRVAIAGFEAIAEDEENVQIKIGAGEHWDEAVSKTVGMKVSGIEALSAIPGTAGATPVQNVGAYGQEIADVLVELDALDLATGMVETIPRPACGFGYRDSKFKGEWRGKYVIVSITLSLSKKAPEMPRYPGVEAYFKKAGIQNPSLRQIRDAIIEIRKKKLPDPKDVASCGSFFKNPIVSAAKAEEIKQKYPDVVSFAQQGGVKLAAGWMLERLGLKGRTFGRIGVYSHNALVLVNLGGATALELDEAVSAIQEQAREAFGVWLEPEVARIA